jgi:hemerythrin
MASIGYPELDIHKVHHNQIIKSMGEFTKQLSTMRVVEIEKELAHLVEIWFVHHIVYVDKKISVWLRTNEIPEFKFSWKSNYSLNNTLLDAQHQELFEIASKAFVYAPNKNQIKKIENTLNELVINFKEHFKDEEEYMQKIKFDRLKEHEEAHKKILNELNVFLKDVKKMKILDTQERLKEFIEISLVGHILEKDRKIASWNQYLKDIKEAKELKERL